MINLIVVGLYIPSFFNMVYIFKKEKKLHLEFDKKLKDKGYEKTNDDSNLISLIANKVVDREEYAVRLMLCMFPVVNLYPFIQIITKEVDKENNTILNSLDNKEVLDSLEESRHIYNQNTILRGKANIVSKIDEMSKVDEINKTTNKHIVISENDSLEQLKQKEALLDEMIYLKSLEEKAQVALPQEYTEDKIEKEYPKLVINEKTIEGIKRHPEFYLGAPVRFQMGKIYKDGEFEKRSDEVLSRELPGGEEKPSVLKKLFNPKK